MFYILLTACGWGLLAPFFKLIFASDPATFDGMSLAVARATWTLPFMAFLLATAWMLERPTFDRRSMLAFAVLGVIFGPAFMGIYSVATQHTSVSHVAFLVGLAPACSAALASIVFHTPLDRVRKVALALGVCGVALLAFTKSGNGASLLGDGLLVIWLGFFAVYSSVLRSMLTRYRLLFTMSLSGLIGTLLVSVIGIAIGKGGAIVHVTQTSAVSWYFFAEIIVLSTLIAPIAYAQAVRTAGVAIATSAAEYVAIAIGLGFSIAVLHETWQPLLTVAGITMLASLALTFAPAGLFGVEGERRPIA